MAKNTVRKKQSRRHVIIVDITNAIKLLISNDEIMDIDLQSPILTIIDTLTYKYPFIDNVGVVMEVLEVYGKYDIRSDIDKYEAILNLLHDVAISIYNELNKYFKEEDVLTVKKLCWVNDSSIAFIL